MSLYFLVTDDLFNGNGLFYVMRETDLKPLEDLFRAEKMKRARPNKTSRYTLPRSLSPL